MGSCRDVSQPAAKAFVKELYILMAKCKELRIIPLLLLNSTIIDYTKVNIIIRSIDYLKKKGLLNHVVVTDPYLIMKIREFSPDIFIEVSIVAHVRTLEEARYFKDLRVDCVTVDREIIRNISLIKKMRNILRIKVLLNEGCLKNCIYRYSHYNYISYCTGKFRNAKKILRSSESTKIDSMCRMNALKRPYKFFSAPFVRPEDLNHYLGSDLDFKLSTRNFDTPALEECLVAYSERRYAGNLLKLLSTRAFCMFEYVDNLKLNNVKFFERLSSCNDDCEKCRFCKDLFKKTVSVVKQCLNCKHFDINDNEKTLLEQCVSNFKIKKAVQC